MPAVAGGGNTGDMRAGGVGGRQRHGLLGFLDAIPQRVINDARALAAACVLAQGGNAGAAELVLTVARDCVAETRIAALLGSPPPQPTVDAAPFPLPTDAAARRLGCSADELRARHRRGEIPAMQAKARGRLQFDPADLERYRAAHTVGSLSACVDPRYTPPDDTRRRARHPAPLEPDPGGPRRGARRNGNDGRPLGARATTRRPAGDACPVAPNASAWATRPAWGDDDADPPAGEG